MRKCSYVIFLIVFLPSLSIAQIDAEAIFVWDNDRGKSDQDNPSVGMFNNSEGFAAWDDARWGDNDVFGQEYNMERGLVGKNFPISIDNYNKFQQYHTDISCNPKNIFITVWEESLYNPEQKPAVLYSMIFDKEPVLIWEDEEKSGKYPSVSSRAEGWHAISWTATHPAEYPAILCMINNEGGGFVDFHVVCAGVRISDYVPKSNVAYCDSGGMVVYEDWVDDGTEYSIYGQYFKPDGGIIDNRFKISYYGGSDLKDEQDPDVAVNENGDMVVVWVDNSSGTSKIYGQKMRVKSNGYGFLDGPFAVAPDAGSQLNPRVAIGKNNSVDFADFIIVWEEQGSDWDVWGKAWLGQEPKAAFEIPEINTNDQANAYAAARWSDLISIVWTSWAFHDKHGDVFLRNFKFDNGSGTGVTSLSGDIPLVPMNPDTGVGGRRCWYHDNEDYDDTTTADWNEDPIPEPESVYVDLEYAIVDQLMELNTNGQYVIDCEDTLPFEQGDALTDYDAVFLDLGYRTTLSSAGTITQTERNELSAYVDTSSVHTGGPLMVDGNDFGYMYDTTQLFSKYFGVEFKGDGAPYTTGNIDTLYGDEDAFAKGQELPYCYKDLPDNYPDSIRPTGNGKLILEGGDFSEWMAGYSVGSSMAWFDQVRTQYSTIYNSFIPSAITGTIHPHTYSEYSRRCLGHLGLLVQPEPIVDLSADTAGLNEGEVELSWTIVSDDKIDDPVNDGYQLKFSRTKMTSEAEYDAAEEYYQEWTTPGNVDDPASEVCYGLPPMDTLIFALKVKDEDGLYNALGAEPRSKPKGDSISPHTITVAKNYVKDFMNKYELIEVHHDTTSDSLFVTWDESNIYFGFARRSYESDADLLLYFDIRSNGADSTYPLNGAAGRSYFNADDGIFKPDYCFVIASSSSYRLFEDTSSTKDRVDKWCLVPFNGECEVDNILNNYEYAEIQLPFTDIGYISSNPFKLVVTVQHESSNALKTVFPVFNSTGSGITITQYYVWPYLDDDMVPNRTFDVIGIEEEQVTPDVEMFGKILLAIPNPFASTIDLYLNSSIISSGKQASLRIFDVTGRLVRDFDLTSILHYHTPKVTWDGKNSRGINLPGGVYFCEVKTDEQSVIEKIIYIR